jgi:hypothetical protein
MEYVIHATFIVMFAQKKKEATAVCATKMMDVGSNSSVDTFFTNIASSRSKRKDQNESVRSVVRLRISSLLTKTATISNYERKKKLKKYWEETPFS